MAAVAPTRKPLTSFTIESIVGRRSPPTPTSITNVESDSPQRDGDERTTPPGSNVTSSRFVPTVSISFNGLSGTDSALTAALLRAGAGPGFHCRPPTTSLVLPSDGGAGAPANLGLCGRMFTAGGRLSVPGVNGGNALWSPGMTSSNDAGDAARRAAVAAAAAAAAIYLPGAWQSLQNAANRVCAEYMQHPFVGKQ